MEVVIYDSYVIFSIPFFVVSGPVRFDWCTESSMT